jgi:hypothetical protein
VYRYMAFLALLFRSQWWLKKDKIQFKLQENTACNRPTEIKKARPKTSGITINTTFHQNPQSSFGEETRGGGRQARSLHHVFHFFCL